MMEPVAPHELGRGPLARAALISAGVQVFGENSLASATTREIAQLAGQNISAIAYYFGNKEGLYFAVAHHICDTLVERLGPLLDEIEAQLGQGTHEPEVCLHMFGRLIGASLSTHQEMLTVTSIVVKEQMHPTKAFDILYEGCLERLHQVGARLIEAYTGETPGPARNGVALSCIVGPELGLSLCPRDHCAARRMERHRPRSGRFDRACGHRASLRRFAWLALAPPRWRPALNALAQADSIFSAF